MYKMKIICKVLLYLLLIDKKEMSVCSVQFCRKYFQQGVVAHSCVLVLRKLRQKEWAFRLGWVT